MRKKNRIRSKIFKAFFFVVFFVTTLFAIYSISNQKSEIINSLELEAKSIARMLTYASSDAIVLNDGAHLVEFNYEFLLNNPQVLSILISTTDNTYYSIGKKGWSFKESIQKEFLKHEKEKSSYEMLDSNELKERVFYYVHPIVFSSTNWGHIHLSLSLEKYEQRIEKMYISFFTFFIVLLLVVFLISSFIANRLSHPIISLNRIAKKIAKGNLDVRSTFKSNDEIGELSNTFNEMISKIESSQLELRESYAKLDDRVKERTLELHETNKELNEKTEELAQLNKNLDIKVKEEVENRTKQESILIHQSRLAAMGEMLGNIAHQWRQPLSVVTAAASGLKLEKEFGMSNTEMEMNKLDLIMTTSQELSQTIENFSSFFKPNKEREEFDIEQNIEKALKLVFASLNYHYISVEKDFACNEKVYGYSDEYAQVIMNILNNAKDILIQRHIEGPTIFIKTFIENDEAILTIEDNAGGVDEDIIVKIFDPYFTTKHQSQGTGIGLYMSKMIVENYMNGELNVSNGEHGAIFTVSTPLIKRD